MTELDRANKIAGLFGDEKSVDESLEFTTGGAQSDLPALAAPAKRDKRLEPAPETFKMSSMLIDALVSAWISFVICAVLTFLVTMLLPASDAKTIVTMCDVTIVVSIMSGMLALLASYSPFIMFVLCFIQLVRGVVVGNVFFDAICLSFGIDPNSVAPLKMACAPVITFSLTALPLLVGFYRALCFRCRGCGAASENFSSDVWMATREAKWFDSAMQSKSRCAAISQRCFLHCRMW